MLSNNQLHNVCLIGENSYRRCRFLSQDETDYTKWYCLKKTGKATQINDEIDQYVQDCLIKGKDPKADNFPLSDNCTGYPLLRHIKQGYDCP